MKLLQRCLILLAASFSVVAAPAGDPDTPPATPREFHEQEFSRIFRGLPGESSSPLLEVQDDFDVVYYDLNLDIRDFYNETIVGEVTVHGRALIDGFDEVILDLCSSMIIDSMIAEGTSLAYNHLSHLLTITLNRTYAVSELFAVTVFYHGTPCRTSSWTSFDYWDRPTANGPVPSIATLSEPDGARDWWPSKNLPADKADSARISITVADTIVATSNGVLESLIDLPPDSRTYTWFEKHPIASYLICISATNYVQWDDWYVDPGGDSLPLVHYVYPEKLAQSLVSWSTLPEMLGFLEQTFGEFPFHDEKYGHTMFNFSGAMEHQCNTSYGRNITTGTNFYDWIMIHEAAHQYWGDDVTLRTWENIWLNEGFASYCEALWVEHTEGFEAYKDYMVTGLSVNDPSGPVYDYPSLFDGNTVYDKGGWILHILRGVVRDDSLFFAAFREYRARHAYGTAVTAEFLTDVSDVIGYDVTPFLYTYLYRTNRPHYEVSFGTGIVDGIDRTAVHIRQTQTNPDTTFRTRIELRFGGAQDTSLLIVNSEWAELHFFDLGYTPASLEVDPDNWVLKELTTTSLSPTILNLAVDDGLEAAAYSDTLIAIGGVSPYQWSLPAGTLPDGLLLSESGILSGTPSAYGEFTFTVEVSDILNNTGAREFNLFIRGLPRIPQALTCCLSNPDSLALRWEPAENADLYEVYKSETISIADAILVASVTDTFYTEAIDSGDGIIRFYHVVSVALP